MIEAIVNFLNLKLELLNYFEKRHCLSVLVQNDKGLIYPAEYISEGNYDAIDFDAFDGVSYLRVNGEINVDRIDQKYTPKPRVNVTFPLRLVYAVRKDKLTADDAYSFDRVRASIAKQLESDSIDLTTQLNADKVQISTSGYVSDAKEVWDEETSETGQFQPKFEVVFGAMEVNVVVTTRVECIPAECDDFESDILRTFDFCKPSVFGRLTPSQVSCLETEICTPCADATVTNQTEDYSLSIASGATEKLPFGKVKNKEGNDVQVDYIPAADGYIFEETACPPQTGGYVPPSDWLTLPEVTEGENKLAGIVAVWNITNNYITIQASVSSGTWSVDWGDGNSTTGIASGTNVEHKLDYAGATGDLTTRGYKTALVVVTADSGNFTSFDLVNAHSESTGAYYQPWLNMVVAGSSISSFDIYNTGTEVPLGLLEQLNYVGTNAITNGDNFFKGCSSLKKIVNIDTSGWTTEDNFIDSIPLIESCAFELSGSLRQAFEGCQLEVIEITGNTNFDNFGLIETFRNAKASIITIENPDASSCSNASVCFATTVNLNQTPDLGDTSNITNWSQFADGSGIKIMSAHDLSGGTSFSAWVRNCDNLSRILAFGAVVTHSIEGCNLDVEAMEEYANNLGTVSGQTFTSSNNPASGNWDTTIATNKGWTVVD